MPVTLLRVSRERVIQVLQSKILFMSNDELQHLYNGVMAVRDTKVRIGDDHSDDERL